MRPFVLELGCEELPASHCQMIVDQLDPHTTDALAAENNLRLDRTRLFVTPRRIALVAEHIRQLQTVLSVKGPLYDIAYTKGRPNTIAEKFAAANHLSVQQLTKKTYGDRSYVTADRDLRTEFTANVQAFLNAMLSTLTVTRPMRWDSTDIRFSRPIRWIVCIAGNTVIPVTIGTVTAGRITYGPRFLGSPRIGVGNPRGYEDVLAKHKVVVDHHKRRIIIESILKQLSDHDHLYPSEQAESLLAVNTFLVEYPHPVICHFKKEFLVLPADIITTVLSKQQNCFALKNKTGKLTNIFLVIANFDRNMPLIVQGNETVVTARLRDALFFYNQDSSNLLSDFIPRTKTITFQDKLGSLWDKSKRIDSISRALARYIEVDAAHLAEAARLCKADLASTMVAELPSLEGTLGKLYALDDGIDPDIADALEEYYHPRYSNDTLPTGNLGTLLALADRVDSIVGLFSVGIVPHGSSDPYGLRRIGIGLVRILWERKLDLPLHDLLAPAEHAYGKKIDTAPVNTFLLQRLEQYMKDSPINKPAPHLLRAVVYNSDDIIFHKQAVLEEITRAGTSKRFLALIEHIRRIYNIAIKNKSPKAHRLQPPLNASEKAYVAAISALSAKNQLSLDDLYTLVTAGTTFFEKNMIMADNATERANRLDILRQAHEQIERVIDVPSLLA